MKMIFEVEIFKLTDYEMIDDKSHVSISGGVATHNSEFIEKFNAKNLKDVKEELEERGLEVYSVEENSLWASMEDQAENISYEIVLSKIASIEINSKNLEDYFIEVSNEQS